MTSSIGEWLVSKGALSEDQLREAQAFQRNGNLRLEDSLLKLGMVDATTLARGVAKMAGLPFVDLSKGNISQQVLERVPAEFAQEQGILPVLDKGGKLIVAIDDPFKRIVADQLSFVVGGEVACAIAEPGALKSAISKYYGDGEEESVAASMGASGDDDDSDAPIVRLVTKTFKDAVASRASDIHVEPGHGRVRVRYRVDGILRDIAEHPEHLAAPLLSRLKIMAQMDIAEKRKPQDGRIDLNLGGRPIDVRASLLPTNHGESMVMRLLDRSANLIGLKELGFDGDDFDWFQRLIKRPNGIVLVTGPTGSGKTTTLYAALSQLNRPDLKIITAEDPVEYHLPGVNQIQVHPRIGLTFARILKAMLRAAPNVILVGEIRDLETAEIAIQASLTGHMVFSTLHTNDAPSALTRMMDLGVKPFLVSASIQAVIAQRLVRRLCTECAESYAAEDGELAALGLEGVNPRPEFRRPKGCRTCEGSGYHGRVAIFERLEMDPALRELVFRGGSLDDVRRLALDSGRLKPLIRDGAAKVMAGHTTVTEIMRVTRN